MISHGAPPPTPSEHMAHIFPLPQDTWRTSCNPLRICGPPPPRTSGYMAHILPPPQDTWRISSNPLRTHGAPPPTPSEHMAHILPPPQDTWRISSYPLWSQGVTHPTPPPLDVTGIYYICSTKQGAGASILAELGCGVARRGAGRAETLICN